MSCVVISQPMYFPWVGLLEQYRICDKFVYYDDVQYSKGSFTNRVQIKTQHGIRWLTVPLLDLRLGQKINDVRIDNRKDWRRSHFDMLRQAYGSAPFKNDMFDLVGEVFKSEYQTINELARASTEALVRYFSIIGNETTVLESSSMGIQGSSTRRVVDICTALHADLYLTGHGARHYLDHLSFEGHGIDVAYIDYSLLEYPQNYGPFTPYVSALDLIAHCGPRGVEYIRGQALPWRAFVARQSHNQSQS